MKLKHAAGIALIVAIVGSVLAFVPRLLLFPGSSQPLPSEAELGARRIRPLRYTTADGLTLTGAFFSSGRSEATTAIYFHGNGESAAQNLDVGAALAESGYDTLLAEYRGYGGMRGRPTEKGLYLDAEAAIAALAVPESRLVLVARSVGTGVATEMAARGHGSALVLVSPYTSIIDMGRTMVGPLAPFVVVDHFDNAAKLANLRIPVTVIHGTADGVVPYRMGEALAKLPPRSRLVTMPGVGHNDIPDLAERIVHAIANPP